MSVMKKTGLGRGLGSLIPQVPKTPEKVNTIQSEDSQEVIHMVSVSDIHANPFQPRKEFSNSELDDLASSIKQYGVLTPLIVTQSETGYELIAGERRLRASKLAGLAEVPVIIKTAKEVEKLEIALIENVQRSDLNAMERAHAYHYLMTQFGMSVDDVAKRVGMKAPTIANVVRLLSLPEPIQQALSDGDITLGHAKYIMEGKTDEEKMKIFETVIENKLNIPETGMLAKKVTKKKMQSHKKRYEDPELDDIRRRLEEAFGAKVHLNVAKKRKHKGGNDISGSVQIEFYSKEDLRNLVENVS